jgi:hypothetical protein
VTDGGLSDNNSRISPERVQAFKEIKTPEYKMELSSLLKMLNFWSMYITNRAIIREPLRGLLKKNNVKFQWGDEQQMAWMKV